MKIFSILKVSEYGLYCICLLRNRGCVKAGTMSKVSTTATSPLSFNYEETTSQLIMYSADSIDCNHSPIEDEIRNHDLISFRKISHSLEG